MSQSQLAWVIKNSKDKYVIDSSYNEKQELKHTWTSVPSKAKVFLEYPTDCPANSIVHPVGLHKFLKVELDKNGSPQLVETEPKPFPTNNEFQFAENAISDFIEKSENRITQLKEEIHSLERCITDSKLMEANTQTKDKLEDNNFQKLKDICEGRVFNFAIPFWGRKYYKILGRATVEEEKVTFFDTNCKSIFEIKKHYVKGIQNLNSNQFSVNVFPEDALSYILHIELLQN